MGEIHYNMARTYYNIEELNLALKYAYLAKKRFEQIYNDEDYAKKLILFSRGF
jgi:DNA-binding XRE family transcriptional regulator